MCGDDPCGPEFYRSYDQLSLTRKPYYLDELFDPCTPPPAWASPPRSTSEIVYSTDFAAENDLWRYLSNGNRSATAQVVERNGNYLLQIDVGLQPDDDGYSRWQLRLPNPQGIITNAGTLKARVWVQPVGVSNGGVGLSMSAIDSRVTPLFSETTLGCSEAISGSLDFQIAEIETYCPEGDAAELTLEIGLNPGTSGQILIDRVEIVMEL